MVPCNLLKKDIYTVCTVIKTNRTGSEKFPITWITPDSPVELTINSLENNLNPSIIGKLIITDIIPVSVSRRDKRYYIRTRIINDRIDSYRVFKMIWSPGPERGAVPSRGTGYGPVGHHPVPMGAGTIRWLCTVQTCDIYFIERVTVKEFPRVDLGRNRLRDRRERILLQLPEMKSYYNLIFSSGSVGYDETIYIRLLMVSEVSSSVSVQFRAAVRYRYQ